MIANKDSGSNLAVVRGHHMGDAAAFGEPIIELDDHVERVRREVSA